MNDYISLGNGQFIVQIDINDHIQGKAIKQVINQDKKTIHVLVVKRKTNVIVYPSADFVLQANDALVLLGQLADLRAIAPSLI